MCAATDANLGQRRKHVVVQKARQRHVPTLPEFQEVGPAKRRVEIAWQLYTEDQSKTYGDVGVTCKIEEYLKREGRRHPCRAAGNGPRQGLRIDRIHIASEHIADGNLR